MKKSVEIDDDSVECINCGHIGNKHDFGKDQNTCPACGKSGCNIWADTRCPVSNLPCDEKKNTCAPDWGGHGEPAFCHLK
jgi:Zn finger protein HypA/HybF involved in hydrogenase expression